MASLSSYIPDTDRNNIVIQKALRDTDARVFVDCMCGLDEESAQAVYRNMSKRAYEELKKDVDEARGRIRPEQAKSGLSFFTRKLAHYARQEEAGSAPARFSDDADTMEAIAANIVHIAQCVGRDDYDEIERIRSRTRDPMIKAGLRYVIDSEDAIEARSRLEKIRAIALAKIAARMDLVIEGIDSILCKDSPGQTAEKLATLADA